MRSTLGWALLVAGLLGLAFTSPNSASGGKPKPLHVRRDTLDNCVAELAKFMQSSSILERQDAEWQLEKLGPKAKAAVPVLVDLLKDKDLDKQHRTCRVLARIGRDAKPALPWLISVLQGPQYPHGLIRDESNLHGSAADALAAIGPDAIEAFLPLTKIMEDKNSHARDSAALAIFYITKDTTRVAPVFHEILKTSGADGRGGAISFFRRFAADYEPLVPTLLEIVRNPDGNSYLVPDAARLLWIIAKHEEAIPALLSQLKSGNDRDAAEQLAAIGEPAKEAIPLLIDKVKRSADLPPGKNPRQRNNDLGQLLTWARCLGKFGPDAKEAVPALEPLLEHFNIGIRMEAAKSLWLIEKSEKALACLKPFMKAVSSIRLQAVGILIDIGQLPEDAVPLITELLQINDFEIRDQAEEMLTKIASKKAPPK